MGFQVTTCPGCACGCGILLEEEHGILTAAHPISGHPVSKGRLCIRGWNSADSWRHPDRLTTPLLRKDGSLAPVPPEPALDSICGCLQKAPHGSVCFAVAPTVSNEDILAIRRLAQHLRARVVDVDFSGVPTARRALLQVLGRHYCSSSVGQLEQAQLIWVFGADVENYPQVASAITKAESGGGRVVAFDTFLTPEKANRRQIYVPPDEFELLPLLLQKCAFETGPQRPAVASRAGVVELIAELRDTSWMPGNAVLQENLIRELVESFRGCMDAAVVIGDRWLTMGRSAFSQTAQLLQAIALLGAEDRLVIAAGEANSWGLADLLTPVDSDSQALAALLNGEAADISVLVTCGDDLLSSVPCPGNVEDALGLIGTVIVIDRFKNQLMRVADAVLPSACFAELDGTVTNAFGMVQRWRRAVPPAGEALPERTWFGRIASRLGAKSWPENPLDWWATEQAAQSPYNVCGLRPLYEGADSAGWLLREATHLTLFEPPGPFTSRTAGDEFAQAIFTRHPANWMTGTWSHRDEILKRESTEPILSLAPQELEARGIKSGARVRLVTQEGSAVYVACGDSRLPRGLVSLAEVPGSPDIPRSLLAGSDDGISFQPVPCRVEKI